MVAYVTYGIHSFDKIYDWSKPFGELENGEYIMSIPLNNKNYTVKFIIDN